MLFLKNIEFFKIFSDIFFCLQNKTTINEQIIQQSIKALTFIMLKLVLIQDHVSLQPHLFDIFR